MRISAKHLFVAIGLLGGLMLFFLKTNGIIPAEHERFNRSLRRLQQLDATVNQDVLKARFHLLEDYDGFPGPIEELQRRTADLAIIPAFISKAGQQAIRQKAGALSALVAQKEEQIEHFKSQNAVLNTSVRYLPVSGTALITHAATDEHGQELDELLNALVRQVLVYSLQSSEDPIRGIKASLEKLETWRSQHGDYAQDGALMSLTGHVNSILRRKPKVEALTQQIVSLPISQSAEELLGAYDGQFSAAMYTAEFYRIALYLLCGVLVVGIGSTVFALDKANTNLEGRVDERTGDLLRKNEELLASEEKSHRLVAILESTTDMVSIADPFGKVLYLNRSGRTLLGVGQEEDVTRTAIAEFLPDPATHPVLTEGIPTAVREGAWSGEVIFASRSGVETPVSQVILAHKSADGRLESLSTIVRDITAHRQIESDLRAATANAEAANRAKSEFLANMSHEIRTPMNGIIGMTELVLDTELNREQREYLGMAKFSADALLALINDILDFSKIEAGKLELEAISFSLRDCLRTMLKPFGLRADQKGIELTADIPADVPDHLVGDPTRLRQILSNLTDNALKFTAGGDVMLRVAVESKTEAEYVLRFAVADTGLGIAPEKMELIFEAFAQADGSTTRTFGGTGLGLAIASRIVRQMGGQIRVESTVGEGTTFHFTARLPVRHTPAPDTRQIDPRQIDGLPVLVVDDNAVNRRILREMLAQWRMQPAVVASGAAAIVEMLRAAHAGAPFPLVILDGVMPDMDGFMVAEKIREHAELSGATVMMLSSAMPGGAATRCHELGVASYLTKPVSQSELLDAILIAVGTTAPAAPADKIAPPPRPANSLRILLAEDNVINRALAAAILEKRGHSLVHAVNGREAGEAVAREAFDLVFMDVQMPEMDGLEATRRIRVSEQATGRHTTIVAMTAHAMAGDRERCLAAGMDDYISKPLQKAELVALLDRATARRAHPDAEEGANAARALSIFSREELLDQVDGDEALLRRMITLFQENTPHLLDDIRGSIARHGATDLARSAHALLSTLGAFGAHDAHRLTQQLEAQAQRENYAHTERTFAALERETAAIHTALARFTPARA